MADDRDTTRQRLRESLRAKRDMRTGGISGAGRGGPRGAVESAQGIEELVMRTFGDDADALRMATTLLQNADALRGGSAHTRANAVTNALRTTDVGGGSIVDDDEAPPPDV